MGICSTTYGDLVCRGCKRFAHEIVEWNGYGEPQRSAIWVRLIELRDGSVTAILSEGQLHSLAERGNELRLPNVEAMSDASRAYEALRRLARFASQADPNAIPDAGAGETPRTMLERIDQEFYARSLAVFERSFKVPAQ